MRDKEFWLRALYGIKADLQKIVDASNATLSRTHNEPKPEPTKMQQINELAAQYPIVQELMQIATLDKLANMQWAENAQQVMRLLAEKSQLTETIKSLLQERAP